MLLGCDTMVALPNSTKSRQTLFAKNSDRAQEECQPMVQRTRATHASGATTRCQFVTLPEVATTHGHVGSRPYWCWGYEHGFNEHQVVIGNEGLTSKFPEFQEPKLVGMELVRLGLERGRTAADAVEVMTTLISTYGQGRFRNDQGVRTYDNGYIVADPGEAYVIETAGHEWVVKKVDSTLGISNIHSVGADWQMLSPTAESRATEWGWWQPGSGRINFAEAYCDFPNREAGRGTQRSDRSCTVLRKHSGETDIRTMMALLCDHSDGENPHEPIREELPTTISICMHYTGQRHGNTAASLVADLCADGSRLPVYWCSLYSPCLGPFLPVFIEGQLPTVLAVGSEQPSDDSPWWLFRDLERSVRRGDQFDADGIAEIRSTWAEFQEELLDSAYRIAAEARERLDAGQEQYAYQILSRYMNRNLERALSTVREVLTRDPVELPATS
jgi:secernin